MLKVRNKSLPIAFLLISTILFGILACGGRVFAERTVYAARLGSVSEFYNPVLDKIIEESVWVFYPDGSFKAVIERNGDVQELEGKYEGDETGSGFHFFLEWDGDDMFDEAILSVSENNEYIEWKSGNKTLIYLRATSDN